MLQTVDSIFPAPYGALAAVVMGFLLLVIGGDSLVRGAVGLATRLGVPTLLIALTIVAFGTSAPEIFISVNAALRDQGGIAIGNIVGSNISNVLLVVGLPALISPAVAGDPGIRSNVLAMIGATLLFAGTILTGHLTWLTGALLLGALAAYLTWIAVTAMDARAATFTTEVAEIEARAPGPLGRSAILVVLGLLALPVGATLVVDGGTEIALTFGVSETVIGLTLVAVGTSLPELTTSLIAAVHRHGSVALGNVIGSNLFNALAVGGTASVVGGRLQVPPEILRFDLWIMLGTTALLAAFVLAGRPVGRIAGTAMVVAYVAYVAALLGAL